MKSQVLALVVLSTSALAACVYDDEPPRSLTKDPKPYTPDPAASNSTGVPSAPNRTPPTSTSPSPMLVEVDADQTMDAVGGDGVGVFVEYAKGGHWHLWWTCDTTRSQQTCEFSVSAAAASGNVTNVDAAELEGGYVASSTASRVEARSTTTTQVHGVRFDTAPGAVITVDASIGGLKDGAFLFFVQGGKLKGGFAGKLTNPLQFQGSAP